MTNELLCYVMMTVAIAAALGLIFGYAWGRSTLKNLRAKLEVAEAAVIQKQGQLNQANAQLERIEQEFAEGRWEAV